jgi:hypothetical protein
MLKCLKGTDFMKCFDYISNVDVSVNVILRERWKGLLKKYKKFILKQERLASDCLVLPVSGNLGVP